MNARAQFLATAEDTDSITAPSYDDVVYIPNDPAADWAGLVKKRGSKVHFPMTQSSVLVAHPVGGLTGGGSLGTGKHPIPPSVTSSYKRRASNSSVSASTFAICRQECDKNSSWKTSYEAFATNQPTPRDVMNPLKLRPRRFEKQQHGLSKDVFEEKKHNGSPSNLPVCPVTNECSDTLVGFRAPPAFRRNGTYLSGIGKKLLEDKYVP